MRGDVIIVEEHHRRAAELIVPFLLGRIGESDRKFTLSVAGESGSGKSETARAIAELLAARGCESITFQQDDYFIHPPKSNDRTRRADIEWVGPGEVRLDLLDAHLLAFRDNVAEIEKPLVDYETDSVTTEILDVGGARVAIAEGTYTSLLENLDARIFIARDHLQTRVHREKRKRDAAELDPFIDKVLAIEHDIISKHRARAHILIDADYSVTVLD